MFLDILGYKLGRFFTAIPSIPKEIFLRTLSKDNYGIIFGDFKLIDYVFLCLSLVSLVTLVKIKF